jgi:hypothetical protein
MGDFSRFLAEGWSVSTDPGYSAMVALGRGMATRADQAADQLIRLAGEIRKLADLAVDDVPHRDGGPLRPAIAATADELGAAADQLVAAAKVALAHAGAWKVFMSDTSDELEELANWAQEPPWARRREEDQNGGALPSD